MKKFVFNYGMNLIIALSIILALCLPEKGYTQENSTLFALMELMKVEPENDGKYLDVERNLWKPIHQERVKNGNIVGWILYRIWFKGANDDYNYATVTLFDNPDNLENPNEGIQFTDVHPDKDMDEFIEETVASRKLVQSRLLQRVNFAYPDGKEVAAPSKYFVVNYMKSVPGSSFLNFENEMAKPIHEVLIKSGEWNGWSVWSNIFPRGTNVSHQFVTIDYYSDFSKIGSLNYMNAFEKAHPDKDWDEYAKTVEASRELVLSELWQVVDVVMKE